MTSMGQPASPAGAERAGPATLVIEAIVTVVLMLVAFLALDDITTDHARGFAPEFRLLTVCGAWLTVFVIQLWRKGHPGQAAISLAALVAAASASSDGIGHARDGGWGVFWPEYSVILAAWLWFVGLAVRVLVRGFRSSAAGERASTT